MDIIEHSLENSGVKRRICGSNGGGKGMNGEVTEGLSIVEEDSSGDDATPAATATLLDTNIHDAEEDIQYEFRDEGVTYRLVQVPEETIPGGEPISPTAFTAGSSPTPVQMLYTNPVNGGQLKGAHGVYVVGAPREMFPITSDQRTILPRAEESTKPAITRDDKRRQTHNEVERRRRDKINNWIMKLSKTIPECKQESSKGSFESQSKCGILAKACDYIVELRDSNQQLMSCVKEGEQLAGRVESLAREVEELKVENQQLRAIFVQNGIPMP